MRVLHVLDASLPIIAGYTTRTASILEAQAALGLSPVALTGLRQGSLIDRDVVNGILHYRTTVPEGLASVAQTPLAREALEMGLLARRALQIHRENPCDIIHAHSPVLTGIPALAVARRVGIPCVYEIRAFWEDAAVDQGKGLERSPRWRAIHALETALCHGVDAVVALCEGIRRDLVNRGIPEERVSIVPNGVDTRKFAPRYRDEALADRYGLRGKIVIAYVGKLFRFEGVRLLLDALSRLIGQDDRIRGLIIGHGEAEAELHEQHEKLGLQGKVILGGKIPPADIPALYGLADVLAYPRERRRITELTTPLKPLEAMSMAKPVVVSDVGGLRELVTDQITGMFFRAGDVDDLARVLGQLCRDGDLRRRLGERGRAEMIRHRSWSTITQRYQAVYEAAAERRMRRAGWMERAARAVKVG
jgi:PEP-CTERM/exosortase A-associated glycosyltransferase